MPLAVLVQQEVARETSLPLLPKNWASHLLRGKYVRWLEEENRVQNGSG